MLSSSELKMLSEVNKGNNTPFSLTETENKTKAQIYKVLKSLRKKEILRLEEGKVIIEDKTHIILLLNVLRRLHGSYEALSNSGTEILAELATAPLSINELTERIGVDRTTISRKIKKMESRSMVIKENREYSLNREVWPDLSEFAISYSLYLKNNDHRAIRGSRVYHVSKDLIIFSNDSAADLTKTAFSRYEEFGIKIGLRTIYYCNLERDLSVSDVFLHSLYVISDSEDWWLRMMALILYAKYKDELKGTRHKMKDEMDIVLAGSVVKGWVPLQEMRERADVYGVEL
ncbi:MAG: MarR family transcriptional regulator [Methanomassiliicoccaceae archaeon]|nr:MarR family transcriptional regulator [Methanomassiliicoccaceae archaeon]